MPKIVTLVDHPLVRHKLSLMRAADTSTSKFRQLMREISLLLGYEATRDLALEETEIETPLERAPMPVLAGKKLCLVSILRARASTSREIAATAELPVASIGSSSMTSRSDRSSGSFR